MMCLSRILKVIPIMLLSVGLIGLSSIPLAAQVVTIPQSATITSATFSILSYGLPSNQTVWVHQVNKDWSELGVTWNNFMVGNPGDPPSFNPVPFASFSTALNGFHAVDVTAQVQAWVGGASPNYGFLLEQGFTAATLYTSSEFSIVASRPKLDIFYTTVDGAFHVTIQRPATLQDGVADAYLWPFRPDDNFGAVTPLYTGNVNGTEKQALVRFYFDVVPDQPSPGTGTPGYWMNHPEAWPVEWLVIGGVTYTKDEAIAIMRMPTGTDMTYLLFQHLVAAILNVEIGNAASCISTAISEAQDWMTAHPLGSGVMAGKKTAWSNGGEALKDLLDDYNNGLLCAPARY